MKVPQTSDALREQQMRIEQYKKRVKEVKPKPPVVRNAVKAFLVGG